MKAILQNPRRGMMNRPWMIFVCAISTLLFLDAQVMLGANRYAVANGNWNATNTWSATSGGAAGASVPVAGDDVYIGEGATNRTVTIPTGYSAACASLTMGTTTDNTVAILNFTDATNTLTVSGNVTMNRANGGATSSIGIGAGTMTVNGNIVLSYYTISATNNNRINQITISTGTLNANGDLTLRCESTDGAQSKIVFSGAGTLNIVGHFTLLNNYGTLTPSTSTVNFKGTSAQTIPIGVSAVTYNNLTINNTHSSGATLSAAVTATNVTGTIDVASGLLNTNNVAVARGASDNLTVASGATLNAGTTSITWGGASGTATINGTFKTANTVGFSGAAGTAISSTNTPTITLGASSTIEYNAAGNQAVTTRTYNGNLALSGSGNKTFAGNTTVTSNFAISGSAVALLANGTTSTANTLTLGGAGAVNGSWGGTTSAATNKNATYFGSTTTGIVNVTTGGCTAPAAPISGGNQTICTGQPIPPLTVTVGAGETADWYAAPTGGTLLLAGSLSYTTGTAGTYYAEARNTTTGCVSATRTGVTLTVTAAAYYRSKTSGNWNSNSTWESSCDGSTWNPATSTPGAIHDVLVQAGHTVTLTQNEACNNLTLNGTVDLDVHKLDVNGTLSGTGGFLIEPTSNLEVGGGTIPPVTLNNLTITGNTNLTGNVTVNGALTLTSGVVFVGPNNLTLGPSASLSGTPSATNMVVVTGTGEFRKEFTGPGSFLFPVGDNDGTPEYSPITLNFSSGSFSSAYAAIQLRNSKHPTNPSINDYINRFWIVTSSGISSFSCDVTCQYVDADIMGTEANMYCGKYDGFWTMLNPVNAGLNQLTGTVASFSDFTGGEAGALPVELVSFSGNYRNGIVDLAWKTATEANNYGFDVERSADNSSWSSIGFVHGSGTVNAPRRYSFADNLSASDQANSVLYYRLRQLDRDGSFKYSSVVAVKIGGELSFSLRQNYPNPFNPTTNISFSLKDAQPVTLVVYDALGKEVRRVYDSELLTAGDHVVSFDASGLPTGVYKYELITSSGSFIRTMTLVR